MLSGLLVPALPDQTLSFFGHHECEHARSSAPHNDALGTVGLYVYSGRLWSRIEGTISGYLYIFFVEGFLEGLAGAVYGGAVRLRDEAVLRMGYR